MFAPRSAPYLGAGLVVVLLVGIGLFLGTGPRSILLALEVVLLGVWLFLAWFFRDPERTPGRGIVSAADGRVISVAPEGENLRVAVFMNVTDVHVNRFPVDGRVESVDFSGAGFRPAYVPDARHNRQCRYRLSTHLGTVEVIQMTGAVARRLVPFVAPGDERPRGSRIGMIVLGSRVDVLLPAARVTAAVRPGDRVRAGTSTIAEERVA